MRRTRSIGKARRQAGATKQTDVRGLYDEGGKPRNCSMLSEVAIF
jgi:hypothetical protein